MALETGGCRSGALTVSPDFSGVSGCANPWSSSDVAAYTYTVPYGSANRARLVAMCVSSNSSGVSVTPGAENYGCKVTITNAKSVGTGACAGCSEGACLTLRSVKLTEAVTNREVMLFGPPSQTGVTWQTGRPVCPLSWPTVSINDVSAAEGHSGTTPFNFTVSLSETSPVSVSVAYTTADSTAQAGSDYVAAAGMLTFTSGQVTKPLPVSVNGDANFEGNESFLVKLTPLHDAGPGDTQGVGTIVDDDAPPAISISDVTANEGDADSTTFFTFAVGLSAASWRPITVACATADGTATAPGDYAAAADTLSFAPGETTKPVVITVHGDYVYEVDETFTVRLSAATNATIADSTATGTIHNDDYGGACETGSVDFGDAPEDAPAYPGVIGHFPTCLSAGLPGDRTTDCGTALGSAPGATGYVRHTQGAFGYWLGCGPSVPPYPPIPLGIDSETNGKFNTSGGAVSECASGVNVDCSETPWTYPGSFGQDECTGDDWDAGVTTSDLPSLGNGYCGVAWLPFRTYNCGPPRQVYLNILIDWNSDGDWNDAVTCRYDVGCVPEWCVKNALITLPSGCNRVTSPRFRMGWTSAGLWAWMRLTISNSPASNSFPWNGGLLTGGETEDYPLDEPRATLGGPPMQHVLGDAPEGIPAYSDGVVGRFPNCEVGASVTGTQEIECGAPGSTPGLARLLRRQLLALDRHGRNGRRHLRARGRAGGRVRVRRDVGLLAGGLRADVRPGRVHRRPGRRRGVDLARGRHGGECHAVHGALRHGEHRLSQHSGRLERRWGLERRSPERGLAVRPGVGGEELRLRARRWLPPDHLADVPRGAARGRELDADHARRRAGAE